MASATFQRGLTAVLDTYLIYASETNFGTADPLQIGNSATVGKCARPIGRALLRFDLSAIPAGSTISSAVLTLKNTGGSIAANYQFAARRIIQPAWTELGATHLTYDGVNNWDLGGGDSTVTGQDTVTVAGGSSDLVFANLAVLVTDALSLRSGLLHLLGAQYGRKHSARSTTSMCARRKTPRPRTGRRSSSTTRRQSS